MTDKIKDVGGRPTKYDPKYDDMIIEHMKEGASMTSFAASIGVARSTINEWMSKNPSFSEAVKIGKAHCAAWWENLGRKGAMGIEDVNPTLVIFGLKNMAADDWRDKQEIDHTTNGENLNAMSPAQAAIERFKKSNESEQ